MSSENNAQCLERRYTKKENKNAKTLIKYVQGSCRHLKLRCACFYQLICSSFGFSGEKKQKEKNTKKKRTKKLGNSVLTASEVFQNERTVL